MRVNKLLIYFLLLCIVGTILAGCGKSREDDSNPDPLVEKGKGNIPEIEDMVLSSEHWKDDFPQIYNSFLMTSRRKDNTVEDSDLGGKSPIDYLKKYPDIAALYDGIGFAKEYYAARGHYYSLEDVINTARPKPGASCLACKTGDYEKLHQKYGDELFAMDFHTTVQEVQNPISCYSCHRNEPGQGVQITKFHLPVVLEKLEFEPKPGTLACAQCHVEYYLDSETKEVILPWDNGVGIEEIESYYDERNFYDWKHPRTGTPLIKVQHPEFELYTGSLHDNLKLSCADCHMPVVEENGERYKSHWAKSPLKTVNESCGECHGDDEQALIDWVQEIQTEIKGKEAEVSGLIVQFIDEFAELVKEKELDEETMERLWSLHRKAQYRWDFVFVENSTGFHNPSEARRALDDAKKYMEEGLKILAKLRNSN